MPSFSSPADPDRLAALQRYQILRTPPESAFDRITTLAAHVFDAPMAGLHFIDETCQWAKSSVGPLSKQMGHDVSFCVHTVEQGQTMVVHDATTDPRFADNALVQGTPPVRFYAGAPLTTPDGHHIGALCVIDTTPRDASAFDAHERTTLESLAAIVMDEMEYRITPRHREEILESITDGFFALDADGTFTYINEQAEQMLACTRDDVIDRSVWEVFPDLKDSIFYEQYQAVKTEQQRVQFETHYAPTDRWLQIKAFPMGSGLSVYMTDINQRKENEQRLQVLSTAIEQAKDAIVITKGRDAENRRELVYVNAAFEEMTGYARDEVLGRTPKIFQGPETSPDVLEGLHEALTEGLSWSGEAVNYRKDGTPFILEWNVAPVRDDAGTIAYWVSSQRDVTEQRAFEEELIEAKETAEEMNRLKSAFLANMSHEIRTPLTSVIGFSELLRTMDLPDSASRFAERIHRGGKRLHDTLNMILDLSQIESGSVALHPEEADLRPLVCDVVDHFSARAKTANVQIEVDLPNDPVHGCFDTTAVYRVLRHLIDNAIKFTGEGGMEGGRVRVSLHAHDDTNEDNVAICIEDSGVGIEKDFMPHLFDAFKQESTGHSREFEGAGLGLAIAYHLVNLMGGTLTVESTKGKGTTVMLTLPRTSPSPDEDNQSNDSAASLSSHSNHSSGTS